MIDLCCNVHRCNEAAERHATNFTLADLALVDRLLRWPPARLFPALDVARLVALDPNGAAHLAAGAGDGGLGAALHSATIGIALSSNQQTGLKLLCNTLRHTDLQQWLQANLPALQDGFAQCCSSEQKNVRLSYASFMLNLSTLFYGTLRDDVEGQAQALSALSELLGKTPYSEADTVYRGLLAVGTIASISADSRQNAQSLGLDTTLQDVQQKTSGKVHDTARAALQALQS
eukprot:jgi/Astpho2/8959/Aster-02637